MEKASLTLVSFLIYTTFQHFANVFLALGAVHVDTLCVFCPQASTCPHLSDATAAISTRRPSPTDRCLLTLAVSRKGAVSISLSHMALLHD